VEAWEGWLAALVSNMHCSSDKMHISKSKKIPTVSTFALLGLDYEPVSSQSLNFEVGLKLWLSMLNCQHGATKFTIMTTFSSKDNKTLSMITPDTEVVMQWHVL
jgi:hypothetical protein